MVYKLKKTQGNICIYAGPGTSEECIGNTIYTLEQILKNKYIIRRIGPEEVCSVKWTKDTALFIMPGGSDILYTQHLNSLGNKRIKKFVKNGGAYLGLCAGAYYGSKNIEFASGTDLEVIGARELAFFEGIAYGPSLARYDYKIRSGARAAALKWCIDEKPFQNNKYLVAYYNGGCHFHRADTYKNVKVLAKYEIFDEAAIIQVKVGKGTAILSGVHFEFSPNRLDLQDKFLREIKKLLLPGEKDRNILIYNILERCNLL